MVQYTMYTSSATCAQKLYIYYKIFVNILCVYGVLTYTFKLRTYNKRDNRYSVVGTIKNNRRSTFAGVYMCVRVCVCECV